VLMCVLLAQGLAVAQQTPPARAGQNAAVVEQAKDSTPHPQLNSLFGLPVESIEFAGAPEITRDRLLKHVVQNVGSPLDRGKVQQSIRELFRTGLFENIIVDGQRLNGGVLVTFRLTRNYFVGNIEILGLPKHGPPPNQIVNASNLELGELFTDEKLQASFDRMKKVMEDSGYHQATFTAEEDPQPERQQMNIIFHVKPGTVARVGKVIVQGSSGLSAGQVQDIAHIHPGDQVKSQMVTKALQKLRKRFQKQDRLEAQTTVLARKYNPESNTVDYTFSIDRGPLVQISVEGAKIREGLLKRYVPVYEEGAVDADLLNEGTRNLTDYFQTLGFFDVNVSVRKESEPKNDLLRVIYTVDRGSRHKLQVVTLEGNKYFPNDVIRERMSVQPAGWLLSHGRYSASLLARDLNSIRALYQTNGFTKVKVDGKVQDKIENDPERMRVSIKIVEGPQVIVQSLKIWGNSTLDTSELRDLVSTIDGQPFSEVNVSQDRDSILNYYFNRGFPEVQMQATYEPSPDNPDKMDVTYNIKEGQRVFVDDVIVSGLENTKSYVVNREIQSKPKDPLSQSAMLDSQRRLYDLGIFNEVDMAVQNPDGAAERKNLLFEIKEAKRYTFNYGFGLEFGTGVNVGQGTSPQGQAGVSPRVSFDVTRINFRGRDQSIIFKSRLGNLQKRVLLSFDSPKFFDLPSWKWTVSGFYDDTREVNSFRSERLEFATQLEEKVNKAITMLYRFSYRRVQASDFPLGFDQTQIDLNSQPVRVGMPSIAMLRDRRDDPIDATKGNYTLADFGAASSIFGSEANFGRIFFQNSTYHTFKKKFVFARSTRIGFESPYNNTIDVPLPERFYEGGGNSHRGFSINQAGPRDAGSGTPLGGNADFINNLELRLPPVMLPFVQQNLSFVIFHDMGNVFKSGNDLIHNFFQWKQRHPDLCSNPANLDPQVNYDSVCDFKFMAHAIGGGVRYKTPIGPIRVDLGYNLNPAVFQIRTPVTGVPHAETMRRFNIFFSIGQTF
jgi:outer membrane protein insertion porin family